MLNSLSLQTSLLPPKAQTLGGLFGLTSPAGLGAAARALSEPSNTLFDSAIPTPNTSVPFMLRRVQPKIRRVFYSFHYADIFRVNHVRKSGQFRKLDKERWPTPQDRSLWEQAKLKNPGALMAMIDKGLEGTSVTCVLAGSETWSRPWVQYEIAKSIQRGNGLIVVNIHNCKCPRSGYSTEGHNPLAQLAVGYDEMMRPRIFVWLNGSWRLYMRCSKPLGAWPKWLPVAQPGSVTQLSRGTSRYDWVADFGTDKLLHWTDAAAIAAGR